MLKNYIYFVGNYVLKKVQEQNKTLKKSASYQKTKCCTTIEGEKVKRLVWYSNNPELPCLH